MTYSSTLPLRHRRQICPIRPGSRRRCRVALFFGIALFAALFLLVHGAAQAQGAALVKIEHAIQQSETAAAPASAPAAAAPPALNASLDQVINTLQDDARRTALVAQLKAVRAGLGASAPAAASGPAAAASSPLAATGIIGAITEAVDHVDDRLNTHEGPINFWRWRLQLAQTEWRRAITADGTRSPLDALQDFGITILCLALTGWLLRALAHRIRDRRLAHAAPPHLPAAPSWVDVGIYMLRRIGPWAVAFLLATLVSGRMFHRSPGSIAGMVLAYSMLIGAVLGALCQVFFALFNTAHRQRAIMDLRKHAPALLFTAGALAAFGNATSDGRVIAAFGVNLAGAASTLANIGAAIVLGSFAWRFRRAVGQLIALRPLAFRQAHPALVDVLRLCGQAWHVPVLLIAITSVVATVMAAGHADDFLRRSLIVIGLFIAALSLTVLTRPSPKRSMRALRMRDRRRSIYVARFGRFAVALVRVLIWMAFLELSARLWHTSLLSMMEASALGRRIGEAVLGVTITVMVSWLVWLVVDTAILQTLSPEQHGRGPAPSARAKTILPLVRNAFFVTLLVITLIVTLANLGVNVTPLLAGAGVVGLAIGFGAQSLVQDLITGLFIVIEDSIALGDSIELPDHAGVVEAMTIRTIKLRDGKGALHVLPYSQIKAVKNMSRGFAYAVFSISVSYDSNLDQALDLIRQTGNEVGNDLRYAPLLLSGFDVLGLDRFDPSGAIVLAQFKTRPLKQWDITRAFNRRLKQKFDEAGIRMTSPTTMLLDRQAAGGEANEMPENAAAPNADAMAHVQQTTTQR